MSRMTDYILEKEENGELVFDLLRGEYMSPSRSALSDEIAYLEWEISRSKAQLKDKIRDFNRGEVK